jgi:hypothetical protein
MVGNPGLEDGYGSSIKTAPHLGTDVRRDRGCWPCLPALRFEQELRIETLNFVRKPRYDLTDIERSSRSL